MRLRFDALFDEPLDLGLYFRFGPGGNLKFDFPDDGGRVGVLEQALAVREVAFVARERPPLAVQEHRHMLHEIADPDAAVALSRIAEDRAADGAGDAR